MRAAERDALRALRGAAARQMERQGRAVSRGRVTSLDPLAIDLLGTDLSLGEDDVDLSQDVERYDAHEGLAVDDILVIVEVGEGDWLAVTVIADIAVEHFATESELAAAVAALEADIAAIGGGGETGYHHVQSVPASTWSIPHGLGRYPGYVAVDSAGTEVRGAESYPDTNTLVLTFIANGAPVTFAGVADLI